MGAGADILKKALLPTTADSADLRETLSRQIRERSLFSARTTNARYLGKLQQVLADIADGRINQATARSQLRAFGEALGYTAEDGFPGDPLVPPAERGGLTDLLSPKRLNLLLETNQRLARSAKQALDGSSDYALWAFPAWSLTRTHSRRVPRLDWLFRWEAAGQAVNWEGAAHTALGTNLQPRMIALKGSPIWEALGDGAGGYKDATGSRVPPFAFGSGLGWVPVRREDLPAGIKGSPKADKVDIGPAQADWNRVFDAVGAGGIAEVLRKLKGAA